MAVPLIISILQASATVGMGVYQNQQMDDARREARELADVSRQDTLQQQAVENRFARQKQAMDAKALRNQKEVNTLRTEQMESEKQSALEQDRKDILKLGSEKRAESANTNVQSRLSRIGRQMS